MKISNIELISNFLNSNKQNLLINQVNEEIGCFYEMVIKGISEKLNINIDTNEDLNENRSEDLFSEKKIYLYNTSSSKQIEKISNSNSQNIILTDYKNYKKFLKNFISINGYEFEKDLRYFLNEFYEIYDEDLINYCITIPYLMFSEVSKYKLNSQNYVVDTLVKEKSSFILNIRKDIFNLKKTGYDIKKIFFKLKSEVNYKKFSFLIY
tara:strand:- start:1640 stop:2266 length:627 start_codon:yes stop_codon:yes gene_type:complete